MTIHFLRPTALLAGIACVAAASISASADTPGNLVVNSSFEISSRYNGTTLRAFSSEEASGEGHKAWKASSAQGWFAEDGNLSGISVVSSDAHSGKRSLLLTSPDGAARSVISSPDAPAGTGTAVLTAWVKTVGAKGCVDFDLVNGWKQVLQKDAVVRKQIDLPVNCPWTKIMITASSPEKLAGLVRLEVSRGSAWMDDVQIVRSVTPAGFNVRPQEWIRLGLDGFDDEGLPQIRAKSASTVNLIVTNDSRSQLPAPATIWFGPWNNPKARRVEDLPPAKFPPGASRRIRVSILGLPAGAYAFSVSIKQGGRVWRESACPIDLRPQPLPGGAYTEEDLSSRDLLRLAIAPSTLPKDIFGVNNGMIQNPYTGFDPQDCIDAGALGVRCTRGRYTDDVGYMIALGGMNFHAMSLEKPHDPFKSIDDAGPDAPGDARNPAFPDCLDLASPAGMAYLKQRAREAGRWLAKRPLIASYQMANEQKLLNGGRLCPSQAADAAFRSWCQKRYGSIVVANSLWNTQYTTWDQVEQIVSASFLKQQEAQTGDWTACSGHLGPKIVERMRSNPGLAMDWMRWRTDVTLRAYQTFHDEVKKESPATLISTNLDWAALAPETSMPFFRSMDAIMLDLQYASGLPKGFGPVEFLDSLEMAESCAEGKPIWGAETYYQPQWPAEYLALQNWGLAAHGVSNNFVFGWKPYADGRKVTETREWEKPDAPSMWCIIDSDGTKLPGYNAFKHSLAEIGSYHQCYNGFSVKRAPADTAVYLSRDSSEYVQMLTGNSAWGAPWPVWPRSNNDLAFLLRMSGIVFNYVDDDNLPDKPERYRRIVVPASYILSQPAANRLAEFAKNGGTLILAGVSGLRDPWLRQYPNVGGGAWVDLGWKAPDYTTDHVKTTFGGDPGTEFIGTGFGAIPGAQPIKDAAGTLVGWERAWGRGKLIAYGIFPCSLGPSQGPTAVDPHGTPNLRGWIANVISLSGIIPAARWINDGVPIPGPIGCGSPAVEVVVRQKSDREKFLFCLNQGGAGAGTVEALLGAGKWSAVDVVSGRKVEGLVTDGGLWRTRLTLGAFGYSVLYLSRT
ncbi:MAG: beta-galactosidase [Capsulimonadaceae bacterium]|nr:beta-galactosidase [Capsulimonadaceae bacterium]